MTKVVPDGLNLKQVGAYLFDAGLILDQFHGEGFQEAGTVAEDVGTLLETGQGTFGPVPFDVPQQDGIYLIDGGLIIGQFGSPGLKAAGVILTELGTAVETGAGQVGPIRVGSEGVTFTIANKELTGSIGPWA